VRVSDTDLKFVKPTNAVTVKIDFEDIHRRIRKVSSQSPQAELQVTPDGQIIFISDGDVASIGYDGKDFDLIAFFDCLHDMGDPVGVSRHARGAIRGDGTAMIVEPFANDRIEDNLNPVGAVFYSASTLICTPASRSQEVGRCLGAQAGPARLAEVAGEAGFTRFRRATGTPFNDIYEVRA